MLLCLLTEETDHRRQSYQTRLAIDEYLRLTGRKPGQFLFAGRGDGSGSRRGSTPARAGMGGQHRA